MAFCLMASDLRQFARDLTLVLVFLPCHATRLPVKVPSAGSLMGHNLRSISSKGQSIPWARDPAGPTDETDIVYRDKTRKSHREFPRHSQLEKRNGNIFIESDATLETVEPRFGHSLAAINGWNFFGLSCHKLEHTARHRRIGVKDA
ncbi:hypothetical protein LZ30DRAFT_723922 [Colletotrichum cereale]|nr:hypothetical protein LZ30DRAFT_723922 [Colletotrichum cereale]